MTAPTHKEMSQPSMWGYSLNFWDSFGFWLMIAGAAVGAIALLVTLASSIILYQVTKVQQAQLSHDSAVSSERVARFEADAAKARLETEQIKKSFAWRRITSAQAQSLIASLRGKSFKVQFLYETTDVEASVYAAEIAAALEKAGLKVSRVGAGIVIVRKSIIFGLSIVGLESPDKKALVDAFVGAGIPFKDIISSPAGAAIMLRVDPKEPPAL
jgi:hypothetical protein